MKNRIVWTGALALLFGALSQVDTRAAFTNSSGVVITNGTIIVTTRAAGDGHFFLQSSSTICDMDDNRGSGCSPGDVAMCELLQDNGYTTKLLPDKALSWNSYQVANGIPCQDVYGDPEDPQLYYGGAPGPTYTSLSSNVFLSPMLVVISGSGSSSDAIQPNTNGIPIVIGENAIIGSSDAGVPAGHGEHFLYSNRTAGNATTLGGSNLLMKVIDPNHPIMQGIPLDANGCVKILRDPYPNENAHVLSPGGLPNYQISTTYADITPGKSVPAPGLHIIGVSAANTNWVIFAVMDIGGVLGDTTQDSYSPWYNYTTSPCRMVHFFVNEQGSGNSRRCFNALSAWGRVLFLRACQWAMSENLTPYQSLGIIDVSQAGTSQIRLGWTGSKNNNYRIDGTTDFVNWLPIVDSITNNGDGAQITRTLNFAAAPSAVYMRVAHLP